jgi:hypothetical protein
VRNSAADLCNARSRETGRDREAQGRMTGVVELAARVGYSQYLEEAAPRVRFSEPTQNETNLVTSSGKLITC